MNIRGRNRVSTQVRKWLSLPGYNWPVEGAGGAITTDGDYKIHTFLSSGSFIVIQGGSVECLIVAGGGGGTGSIFGGGGGGAGGILYGIKPLESGIYTVTVGAGGGGGAGSSGSDSFLGLMQAFGGGHPTYTQNPTTTRDGGCGAGCVHMNPAGTGGASIQTSNNDLTGYGNKGGNNVYAVPYWDGSGGGAGAAGSTAGAGGAGKAFIIYDGTVRYYAGGGGQCNNSSQVTAGGVGGGGAGSTGTGGSGVANTGGGGGGSKLTAGGGAGGSGIVIVRYKYK